MASKRQTTMAKIAREQAVRERRARKQEKRDRKRAAKAHPETAVAGDEPSAEDAPPVTT
jgi:hypothetical protein